MSDLLEEAKDFFGDGYGRPEKPLIQRLIAEVERLVELEKMVSKELFTGDGELTVGEFKAKMQIESLTRERDAYKDQKEMWQKMYYESLDEREKLEAENAVLKGRLNPFQDSPRIAKLKTDIELLENRLATVLKELAASEKVRLEAEKEIRNINENG